MSRGRAVGAAGAAILAILAALTPATGRYAAIPAAYAQNLGSRVVSGHVMEGDSTYVVGATVFLKNLKNKSIRSFNTTENGRFRFAEVNMIYDYELWAEKNGQKSAVKTVSNWDTRKEFETELKLK